MSNIPRRLGLSESRLDRAIDRAVRDMVQVDPRPGLRGRVLSRLEPEPVRFSMLSRFAIVGAALAVLIVAIGITRWNQRTPAAPAVAQHEQPPSDRSVVTSPPSQPAQPAPSSRQVPVRRAASGSAHPRQTTSEPIPMPRVANVFGGGKSGVAAASADVETVWPASPAPARPEEHPAAPPPLVIPPLDPPAPIVIPPLNPRGPGGGVP